MEILVIDDHPVVSRGISQILDQEHDMRVAAQAGTIDEALLLLRQRSFDVLVLDVNLPGRNGLEARWLRAAADLGVPPRN